MQSRKDRYRTGEKSLTEDELQKVINYCERDRDEVLIKVAAATGMRRSDIVRLQWDNISLDGREVRYKEKKKGDTIHHAYISEKLAGRLRRYQKSDDTNKTWLFDGLVDRVRGRGHISGKTAYNIFQRALEKAGLDQRPFHALRATCIKLCQKKGWQPEATAKHVNDKIETIRYHYKTPTSQKMHELAQENAIL